MATAAALLPVHVLSEHLTALEAALTVCLAGPDEKPVHRLRTATRRVEALLLLLALVPDLPEHSEEATVLRRTLRKLRRAAGEVRDLDVHRALLEDLAAGEDAHPEAVEAAPDLQPAETSAKAAKSAKSDKLGTEAAALRKHMGHDRDKAAAALQQLLKDRQIKVARAAETLLHVLKPAEALELPAVDLLRDAASLLERDHLLSRHKLENLSEDDLHTVRKAAKAARYLAETLPGDPTLTAAAARFESLQEAGGHWHDALELARAARHHFGKARVLTANLREQRDRNLALYRDALRSVTPARSPKRQKSTAAPKTSGKATAKTSRKSPAKTPRTPSRAPRPKVRP